MKAIYEPKGMAREYSELALNLYRGCDHGCYYCYAPSCLRMQKNEFHNNSKVRNGIIKQLQKDLIEMDLNKDNRCTLMCFTSDPYQGDNDFNIITQQAIKLFRAYNKPFQILTKGGMKAVRDFYLYSKNDLFASTLTFDNVEDSIKAEPKAALPDDRIKAIRKAKMNGITTWVSFEPVIVPGQTINLFHKTKDIVDKYKIGKINHHKSDVDWRKFTLQIIELCEKYNKDYLIKDSLKKYL